MAARRDLDKPSLRPGWPAEVASGLGLCRLGHEVPELGFPAFALTRQPGLLVGAGDVSVVGTLLAVEVDLNIAAAALAWGRRRESRLGLRWPPRLGRRGLRLLSEAQDSSRVPSTVKCWLE